MENNEIMNFEAVDVMDDMIMEGEGTGISTGGAMLIGAGLTLAIGAGVKLVKNLWARHKAKKELEQQDHDFCVDNSSTEDVGSK